jgi:hypothetical protein
MTNRREIIECKLEYLYEKLGGLEDFNPNSNQAIFLLNEIDYYRTELLKLETQEYFNLIENEEY